MTGDSVEFEPGTAPGDVWLDRFKWTTYRLDDLDSFDAPDGHEPEGEDMFLAPEAHELAELNGADIELVEASPNDADFGPKLVADMAEVIAVEEIKTDRQLATHTYTAIRKAGKGPFLATPNGDIYVYENGVWNGPPGGEQRLRELGDEALGQFYGGNVLRELKEKVRARHEVPHEQLGRPPGTVATPDGLLDLHTGSIHPLRPTDYVLARVTTTPDDEAPDGEDSRWGEFVEEAVPDGTERAKLQEYAGYTLLPGQPYKRGLFLVGPTDAGKGTFHKAIQAVLGEDNVSHQSLHDLINSRWGFDKIHGKMLNVSDEVSPNAVKRVERFKKLLGGEDTVTAERKGQPTYEFTVTQKFIFATNQFPRVPDADDAFWNRCLFVEFPNTVDDPDEDLLDDLRTERTTILNWMLDGLTRLLNRGRFAGERSLDDRRVLAKSFGTPVEQFVYEALTVTGNPQDVVHQGDLYQAFTRFCHFHEFDETPIKGTFTRQLTAEPGVDTGQSRRVVSPGGDDKPMVYQGVRPVDELFKHVQADVPTHASAEDASHRTQTDVLEDAR